MLFHKIKRLFQQYLKLFGLYLLFFITVAILQSIFPELDLKKYTQDGIREILKDNTFKAFFAMVVFAPLIEELMFRTLLKPSSKDLLLFLSSWTLFIIGFLLNWPEMQWYYRYTILISILIGIFFIYRAVFPKHYLQSIQNFLNTHQLVILQLTSVVFGFLHIFNYVDTFRVDSILFLLIVPRIIAGHMFGKIKIENTHIIWPILLHAINNGVVFLIISNRY